MQFDFDGETQNFLKKHAGENASETFQHRQKICYFLEGFLLLLLLKYRWDYFVFAVTAYFMFWYLAAVLFRGGAALLSIGGRGEEKFPAGVPTLSVKEYPVYTILLPLYREENIASKVVKNILSLDYPREKLDVKLLLEDDDPATRAALSEVILPECCEILTVPGAYPRTKPRACNWGLAQARGEYCVIYDAEDRPEWDQLKKSLEVFRRDRTGNLVCVQAKLNYYNANENLLTKLFTVEYSSYFDLTLCGYNSFGLPLPLGGTSNHFRTELLKKIGPWDPFNVTEDCDLGLRIYEAGYRTMLMDSTTWEEANMRWGNWLRQRSRWVKGFLQTHLVHYRSWPEAVRHLGWKGAFGGFLAVGGSALMMLVNVFFWMLLTLYAGLLIHGIFHGAGVWEQITGPHAAGIYDGIHIGYWKLRAWPLFYSGSEENVVMAFFSQFFFGVSLILLGANFIFIGVGIVACLKRRYYRLIPVALLMPFYWGMISLAAWKGFLQLFTKPFYWEKTVHGLTEIGDRQK